MGGGKWSDDAYSFISTSRTTSTRSSDSYFSSDMSPDMSPFGVAYRESRDSAEHPESIAVQFWLDVTGSMGKIPRDLVGGPGSPGKLSVLMSTLLKHGVRDPQLMFAALGDHYSDRCPVQVGQFESETTLIDKWLTSIFVEGNGGGGGRESYLLAHYFASRHTSADCFEKRGRKGFVFTVGDEMTHPKLEASAVQKLFGDGAESDFHVKDLIAEASRTNHVFHVHISHHGHDTKLQDEWRSLLGQNFLTIDDPNAVPELIAATVATMCGADLADVTSGFDRRIADTVSTALSKVDRSSGMVTGDGIVGL